MFQLSNAGRQIELLDLRLQTRRAFLREAGHKNAIVKPLKSTKSDITGGPPLTRKSLTRFPLTRFLAYVHVSGGISVSRGPEYSPTNTNFM